MAKILAFIIVIILLSGCNDNIDQIGIDDSSRNFSQEQSTATSYDSLSYPIMELIVKNYEATVDTLEKFSFVKLPDGRDYGNGCSSDVYGVYSGGARLHNSPYLEYSECIEGVKMLSLSLSSEHEYIVDRLIQTSTESGFVVFYDEDYGDGEFIKEYSFNRLSIVHERELLPDGSYGVDFDLMFTP